MGIHCGQYGELRTDFYSTSNCKRYKKDILKVDENNNGRVMDNNNNKKKDTDKNRDKDYTRQQEESSFLAKSFF